MRTALVTTLLALLTACSLQQTAKVKADRPLTADEGRIIEIARQAVATNDTWVDRAEFQLPRKNLDGRWSVTVWRLPATPGGFRTITIDENGKVTDYYRGH